MNGKMDWRRDPDYFEHRIRRISDQDLFDSLRMPSALDRSYEAWGKYWQTILPRGRFRDVDDLLATQYDAAESLRASQEEILKSAHRILRHDIQGWGDVSIQHGPVVDFNADHGRSGQYGFHYWFWARPLIQAFLLTQDQQYLAEFDALFNSWYEQRNDLRGQIETLDVVYYELGLGLRNRTFLEYYYLPLATRSVVTHERLLKTLLGAGRWLFHEEQLGYRHGNWQVMGCTGLATIAALLPEFRESQAWLDISIHRLEQHLRLDLYADGCHSERVPSSYMLTVYKDVLNVSELMRLSSFPEDVRELNDSLNRMLHWFMQTLPPDRILPAINDGSRYPLPARILAEGLQNFPSSDAQTSICLPASGFTILRSDWSKNALYMSINHGPKSGGHTHDDALSFEMHAHGLPMGIDSGIGKTYDDPLHRVWYVTPAAHNMLAVDGVELDRAAAQGRDLAFSHLPLLDYFAATHLGYEKSTGVVHRRHVVFVRPLYFLIVDEIWNSSPRDFTWHLHSPLALRQFSNARADLYPEFPHDRGIGNDPALNILTDDPGWILATSRAPASVLGIPGFNEYAEITWLQFKQRLPAARSCIAMLLYPSREQNVDLSFTRTGEGNWTVEHAESTDRVCIDFEKRVASVDRRAR